jgi:hypothetical protein
MIREWIRHDGIKVMNVAGARASKDPKIYQAVTGLLEAVKRVRVTLPKSKRSVKG